MAKRVTWYVVADPLGAQVFAQAEGGDPQRFLKMDLQQAEDFAIHVSELLEHGAREAMFDRLALIAELGMLGLLRRKLGRAAETKLVMTSPLNLMGADDQSLVRRLEAVMRAS